ncbi:MAG: NTP transferase domain-containing protein, partial [Methanobrevibacter sp.]|nr:NTP transferase domain-containing protein [Methanobrevibacter sp.]
MKAVIPAAGFGTRFLPATKAQPKEMLPVYDKPTIQYVIEEAVASGIDDILIVTGRNKRSIEDHFDKSFELEQTLLNAGKDDRLKQVRAITDLADICYVRQKEQKGLGDAIYCAKKHIGGEPFAVLLGDSITKAKTPCTKQLIDVYNKYDASAISIEKVPYEKVERYGIIKGQEVEKDVYN